MFSMFFPRFSMDLQSNKLFLTHLDIGVRQRSLELAHFPTCSEAPVPTSDNFLWQGSKMVSTSTQTVVSHAMPMVRPPGKVLAVRFNLLFVKRGLSRLGMRRRSSIDHFFQLHLRVLEHKRTSEECEIREILSKHHQVESAQFEQLISTKPPIESHVY